jgi:glycosyltransferase involved in cell wall biosynthesis
MKILIFSHEFPPEIGGAGVVAQEYALYLSKAGHEVTVLTQGYADSFDFKSFRTIRVKTMKYLWFFSYRKAIDFKKFDLIILNDIGATYTAGLFFNQSLLAKSIVVLHGSEPEKIFLKPSLKIRLSLFKKIYLRVIDRSRYIIAVSDFMKKKFINYTFRYDLKDKIIVLYNFIDQKIFQPSFDPSFRASIGVPEDAFLLVSVSRLVIGKGYLEKIKIFEKLLDSGRGDFFWVIVGDGPDADRIKNVVNDKKLDDRVIFLGAIPRNDLSRIYSSSDLFWLLSNYEESLGLVYIEAQACGCPALGWNSSGVREAILNGKSGYLVNDESEIISLLLSGCVTHIDSKEVKEFLLRFQGVNLISFIDDVM